MLTPEQTQKFQSLIDDWCKKSLLNSGMCDQYLPFKQAIEIAKTNKEDYLPLLFEAMQRDFRWHVAIHSVLGEDPEIDDEDAGKVDKIINIWINFGKEKGYIKE